MDRDSCKQTPAYVTSVNTRRGGYDGCLCKVEVCGHCFRVIFTRVVCHLGKLVHSRNPCTCLTIQSLKPSLRQNIVAHRIGTCWTDLCSYCLLQLWMVLCVWMPVGTGLGLLLFNIFPSTLCNPSLLFYGPTFTYHVLVLNLVSSLPCFPIFLLCYFTIHISFQSLKLRSQALYNVLLKSL